MKLTSRPIAATLTSGAVRRAVVPAVAAAGSAVGPRRLSLRGCGAGTDRLWCGTQITATVNPMPVAT